MSTNPKQTLTFVRRIQTRSEDRMHSVVIDHNGANTSDHQTQRNETLSESSARFRSLMLSESNWLLPSVGER
jgi:hypothetical protein